MKVTVTFDVDWSGYEYVSDELIVEDMFNNWPEKDGISIEKVHVKRDVDNNIMFETLGAHLRNMYGPYANIVQMLTEINDSERTDERTKTLLRNFLINKTDPRKLQENLQHLIDLSNLPEVENINWRATEMYKNYKEE